MRQLRARLHSFKTAQEGISIVEVLAAMMIFAIIAVGIAYSLVNTLNLTRDSRAREVAIHLAAQEVDKIRSLEDIFDVVSDVQVISVDGAKYTVTRKPAWDNSAGDAIQCGALAGGSGSFEFKRVEVEVSWEGKRSGASSVYSDTIVAPRGRITDPALGTILVSVINSAGTGQGGVGVTASADGHGATAPPEAPPATDTDGCSYVLKVTPGQYLLRVSKSDYVDVQQNLGQSEATLSIAAGELKSVQFQFDQAARFALDLAPNQAGSLTFPSSVPITAANTYGNFHVSGTTLRLHPFPSGYEFFAGWYKPLPVESSPNGGCLSPDPLEWPGLPGGEVGNRGESYTAAPGAQISSVPVRMGAVHVSLNNQQYVRAVAQPKLSGRDDPGCAESYTVEFARFSGARTLALPYGSWKLEYRSGTSGGWSSMGTTGNYRITGFNSPGLLQDNIVTLDPRELP